MLVSKDGKSWHSESNQISLMQKEYNIVTWNPTLRVKLKLESGDEFFVGVRLYFRKSALRMPNMQLPPDQDYGKALWKQLLAGHFTDVIFVMQDGTLEAHANILAASSEKFSKFLAVDSHSEASESGEKSEIIMKHRLEEAEIPARIGKLALEGIYTKQLPPGTSAADLKQIYIFAQKYAVENLLNLVLRTLHGMKLTKSDEFALAEALTRYPSKHAEEFLKEFMKFAWNNKNEGSLRSLGGSYIDNFFKWWQ
jgi:hypothetical protein